MKRLVYIMQKRFTTQGGWSRLQNYFPGTFSIFKRHLFSNSILMGRYLAVFLKQRQTTMLRFVLQA